MVHVRRGRQANIGLREERVELGGWVWLRVVMGRVLPLLVLLSVTVAARSASPTAAGSTSSVFYDSYVCVGGLGEGALQHV